MKRAIVTGGAGFIGSTLCDALLAAGTDVLVIDDLSTGNKANLNEATSTYGTKVTVVETSVTSKEAHDAVLSFRPDVVFHLAAQMNVRKSVEEPAFDANSNVTGTVAMLEAARLAQCKRFVFASTGGAIYGEQEYFPADEQHPIQPKSPYGVGKRAAELYLEYYGRYGGIATTSLRFANIYGPRQNPKGEAGVVAIFINRLLASENLTVNGDGSQTRDFVYVTEVVDACLRAAEMTFAEGFKVFNVGRGIENSVNDIVTVLGDLAKEAGDLKELSVLHGPALAGEQQRSVINSRKLAEELGWETAIDLKAGLSRTLDSFRNKKV